jgi:hypothetical protein
VCVTPDEHADHRPNIRTATNHACRRLFPGPGAGQLLRAETLLDTIREHAVLAAGFPTRVEHPGSFELWGGGTGPRSGLSFPAGIWDPSAPTR